jgi:AcrR family transcriptional regulator
MDGALALFTKQGVGATRVEDITERADVAKGVFYNYFSSKDDLVAELLDEALGALVREYPSLDAEQPPRARTRALAEAHLAHFRSHPEHIVLLHQARGLLKVHASEGGRLKQIFRTYVFDLGGRLLGSARESWTDEQVLELGTVAAGALSGCISYRLAVGLAGVSARLVDVVDGAVTAWIATRPAPDGAP